jgi:tetratricopeptide (TPR) repeat protein
MDRIATFQSFITRTPNDPFPRYGLAMELRTRGDLAAAVAAFTELMDRFPDYVPTYLMAGATLAAFGDKAGAAAVYRRGIEVATTKHDNHARGELQTALTELTELTDGAT